MNAESLLAGLDPEQLEAVTNVRGPVCVIAGAGTGKTRVITHRIAYAIATGVADPNKSLALTFTARAAGEMRARLRTLGVPNAAARTFHSAALKQLMYFWPYSFGGSFPKLLTTKAGFLSEAMSRSDTTLVPGVATLREISGEIEWAKAMQTAPEDYVEAALEIGRSLRIPNGRADKDNYFEIAKVYQSYETLKQQERVIDFEDVLLLTVGMLEEDRDVRERVRDQYRFFTVDEYQDVSPLQQRLLNLWLGNRDDICVVGDAAQTIYSFAGASSSFLLGFTQRYPKAAVVRLNRGYRSTPEIISMANQILRLSESNPENELVSMNDHGGALEIHGFALKARNIETQLKSSERFFDRVDVKDAMRTIRSASVLPLENFEGGHDWVDELASVLRPFGTTDYVRAFISLAREMKENGVGGPTALRSFLRELEDRAEQNNPPTLPGVVLSTLHAAKGLEWDPVFLVGINEGSLPFGYTGSPISAVTLEEERRLFYVGITRAKQGAHLSYSGTPSVFLDGLIN